MNGLKFSTTCIHAGFEEDGHRSHITPIYASSTYLFESAERAVDLFTGKDKGFIYGRFGNPTIDQTEKKIAALEAFGIIENNLPLQLKAILHSSGMGAISTLFLALLKPNDKVLSHYSLYGGTQELLDKVLNTLNIESILIDMKDKDAVEKCLQQNPDIKLIYVETPANPTLTCIDIEMITQLAKQYSKWVAVDNTFATPFLQQPFKFGVDFVIHSTTKFLNGHGTAIGGVLLGRDIELMNTKVTKHHRLLGANTNAFDAYLLNVGIKTLTLRMQQHCENAMKVAMFLQQHAQVNAVHYNGLENHRDYLLCKKQMKAAGAILSFELKGGFDAGKKFINALSMCNHAVSLGTCDTLISHPASTTHAGVPFAVRVQGGITDGLIRMSVGLEDADDIIDDLAQALK